MYNTDARKMVRDFERALGVDLDNPLQREVKGSFEPPLRPNGDDDRETGPWLSLLPENTDYVKPFDHAEEMEGCSEAVAPQGESTEDRDA